MNMPRWINMKRLALLMVLASGSVTHVVAAGDPAARPATPASTQPVTEPAASPAAVPVTARYAGRIYTVVLDDTTKQQVVLDSPVVVRNARDYDAFIARIPAREISKTNPSPPSDDPLLKRPAIDFGTHMLIAVWSRSAA